MTRNDFIRARAYQLEVWGNQFATLEESVRSQPAGRARDDLERRLRDLRREKAALKGRLRRATARAGTLGVTEWKAVREKLEHALDRFRADASEVHQTIQEV